MAYSYQNETMIAHDSILAGLWRTIQAKSRVSNRTKAALSELDEHVLADIGAQDVMENRRAMPKNDARTIVYLMSLR